MSKIDVGRGRKPAASPSVTSKPSATKRPGAAASKPAASPSVTAKPSATKQPGAVASKPSATKQPGAVASKPSATKQPGAVASKPSATKQPGAVASKPSGTKKPGAVASKTSTTKQPSAVASKPSLISRQATATPESDRRFYIVCVIISLLSIAIITMMGFLYSNVDEVESPHNVTMDQVKKTLSAALSRPELEKSDAMQVAEEVKKLPTNIKIAESIYEERKRKYHDLFHKTLRSSSGPWKLHGRSLYYFSKGAKTWYDAENFCISRDAHLASILNDDEQNFIRSQLQRTSWIGLSAEEGTPRWTDGSRLVTQYWPDGQRSQAEDCTLMEPSFAARSWKDEGCHKLHGWICKESLDIDKP
ncbi:uncharacterized protein LOC143819541 [Paroedura picta]|uniref:uncharacterized protein LOC143819541 n=1 Tax=Paroedura picta TaxID=143630 RepID=UPI004057BB1A